MLLVGWGGVQFIYIIYIYIQKLLMDFNLYICYAADGDNIEYFVQHHVRN